MEPTGRVTKSAFALLGAAVVLGGLWWVSQASVSPEQRMANAEPPPAAVVDVQLEERVLEDTIIVRGRVVTAESLDVMAPGAGGLDDEGAGGASVVVDTPVAEGDVVEAGDVVAVVSDRPVFVLPLRVPLHRSLAPGDSGPDVERLQEALAAMGHDVVVDGEFGPGTQAAVRRLYEDRGFTPQSTGPELDEALAAAQQARDDAQRAAADAQSALDTAGDGVDRAPLERALSDARAQLADADAAVREAAGEVGVLAPAGELIAVGSFPVVVSDVPYEVGDVVTDLPVVVLSPSEFLVRADVDPVRAALLVPGTVGVADADETGGGWAVEVIETDSESESESEGVGTEVVLRPTGPLDAGMVGEDVRIEVLLAASDGPVLAAPVGAVRSDADGEFVLVPDVGADDGTRRVGITPGASVGGWVELVDPDDALAPGTPVRLG